MCAASEKGGRDRGEAISTASPQLSTCRHGLPYAREGEKAAASSHRESIHVGAEGEVLELHGYEDGFIVASFAHQCG